MKRCLTIAAICAALALLAGCAGRNSTPPPVAEPPDYQDSGYEQTDYQELAYGALPSYQIPPDEPAYGGPPDTPTNTYGLPVTFTGGASIDYTSEEEMAAYPDAPRFVARESGIWMAFRFDAPVRDVVFVSVGNIGFDDEYRVALFELGAVLYEVGDLEDGQPFFLRAYGHMGTLPGQAIGFTYTDGVRYYIPFEQEQKFGNLVLGTNWAFTVG